MSISIAAALAAVSRVLRGSVLVQLYRAYRQGNMLDRLIEKGDPDLALALAAPLAAYGGSETQVRIGYGGDYVPRPVLRVPGADHPAVRQGQQWPAEIVDLGDEDVPAVEPHERPALDGRVPARLPRFPAHGPHGAASPPPAEAPRARRPQRPLPSG